MRYKPKSIPALHIALGGLPAKMRPALEAAKAQFANTTRWKEQHRPR